MNVISIYKTGRRYMYLYADIWNNVVQYVADIDILNYMAS